MSTVRTNWGCLSQHCQPSPFFLDWVFFRIDRREGKHTFIQSLGIIYSGHLLVLGLLRYVLHTILFIITPFLCLRGFFLSISGENLALPEETLDKYILFLSNLIENLEP